MVRCRRRSKLFEYNHWHMKELTAAFQSEVFRPVATLVVPGFVSISTFSFAVWQWFPGAQRLADQHPSLATTTAILIVLTCGLVTEDVGARIEEFFDKRLSKKEGYEQHFEEWFRYLRIAFEREPVGHRYLRTLVLRLKFELGMTVALLPCALGALFLRWPCLWRWGIFAFAIIALAGFCLEAKASNKTLSDLRRHLLQKDWDVVTQAP
jgi:hypothetical protein